MQRNSAAENNTGNDDPESDDEAGSDSKTDEN